MRKAEERTIDGLRFTVTQMSGMRGYLLTNDLLQLAAPLLGALSGLKVGTKLGDVEIDALAPALAKAIPALSRERQEFLTRELLEQSVVKREVGKEGLIQQPVLAVFDELFQGRALTVYKLLAFSLKVNFGSFLPALDSVGIGRLSLTPSPSETSPTSAGPQSASSSSG